MFPGGAVRLTRDEFRAYVARCRLREACTEAAWTLRGAGEGLAAFLIDNTASTLLNELFKLILSPRERNILPFLGEWDGRGMVAAVKLYAQKAAGVACKDGHFNSLVEYPTGRGLELTAESYLDKMYDRDTGELLWKVATVEDAQMLIHL
jgi:hypothetical protein